MGRNPCCPKGGLNRGAWTVVEDKILTAYIITHGEGRWRNLPQKAGLKRCGKSCRLRWLNYLRPDIKRGNISPDEEELIIRLHRLLGNRWSLIAGRLPGRTDNEIKNYWNTNLGKKVQQKNATNKQQYHPRKLAKTTKDLSSSSSSASPLTTMAAPTQVVRTKAVKCTRVILNPQAHKMLGHGRDVPNIAKEAKLGPSSVKGNYDMLNSGFCSTAATTSCSTTNIDQVQDDDRNYISAPDFVTNLNLATVDELCLAGILNSDYEVLDFLPDYNSTNFGDDNYLSISRTSSKEVQLSSNDFSDLLFSEEMLVQDWSDVQPNWFAD